MHPLRVPRHACSPRDVARAGDLWRLVQEVAVLDATEAGWSPARFREVGTGFVVRSLAGVHGAEVRYGDVLHGTTCVTEVRRELLLRRETALGAALRASVEWVHCGRDGAPTRAPVDMLAALSHTGGRTHRPPMCGPTPSLPALAPVEPLALPLLALEPWWTEMDPVGHVNHPRYVDWADEAVARWLVARGFDPVGVRPVADALTFRAGAAAGQRVEVRATLTAAQGDTAAFDIAVTADGARAAEGRIVRAHLAGSAAWG